MDAVAGGEPRAADRAVSGVVVVDVDVREHVDGRESMRRSLNTGRVGMPVFTVVSPSGGRHGYYPDTPDVVQQSWQVARAWGGGVKAMKVSHTALEKRFGGDGDRSKLEHAHEDRYQALTATQGESADCPGHDGTAGQVSRFPLSSARPTGFSGERVVHHLLRLSTTCTAVSCTSDADGDEDEAEQLK